MHDIDTNADGSQKVLIDTWWNVNLEHSDESTCYGRF